MEEGYFILFIYFYFWLHWVFIAVHGLSLVVASGGYSLLWCVGFPSWWLLLLQSTGSRSVGFRSCGSRALERRLSSCGAWAQLLHSMWDLPGPGIEPMSPALASRFLTTAPPGKSQEEDYFKCNCKQTKETGISFFFFNIIYLFIYLFIFLAVLGLRFCVRAFSSCGKRGPLFIAVRGPLTVAASLVAEHRLQTRRLSSCGSRAQLLRGMWDLPRPGLEPVSPALAGRFSTTAPAGKPYFIFLYLI